MFRFFFSCRFDRALLLLLAVGLTACQGTKSLTSKEKRSLQQLIEASPVIRKSFTGFALYDPESRQWLYQHEADKYYTPASNTKILTLYTALEVLGDNFPLLHYEERGDSLIFWGTGNPALLDPGLPILPDATAFLKQHDGPLFFTEANFRDERFGPGWAWDDFPYYYQPEKSAMPLYGNLVHFRRDSTDEVVRIAPQWFQQFVRSDPALARPNRAPVIVREEFRNDFRIDPAAKSTAVYQRWVPYRSSPEVMLALLQDALQRNVYYLPGFKKEQVQSLNAPSPDTLFRKLMQESDNFIAEQLLLMCADKLFGEMNSTKLIAYARDSLLAGIPDRPEWVDGSGLSRYNLFTPRSVVFVLEKLYRKKSEAWLFDVFPAGGESGTIGNLYAPAAGEQPFVFAKTGSLRHRHCLSGYIRTSAGKTLIFSFMHNNFTGSSTPLKQEMDRVLRWIHGNL